MRKNRTLHQTDYYASGECLSCKGEEAAADRKAYKEKHTQQEFDQEENGKEREGLYKYKGNE
jgi:hypothetical protein